MIKQLRLGNWIQGVSIDKNGNKTYHIPTCVDAIFSDNIYADFEDNQGDVFEYKQEEFEAITLNEEILLKCGFDVFTSNHKGSNMYRLRLNKEKRIDLDAINHSDGWAVHLFVGGTPIKFVDTLHELQNLYFLLTNKELEIKL